MPPAVRPPAKSITPPTHLDEIQSYLVQTAAGAREPPLVVCKHLLRERGGGKAAARLCFFIHFPRTRIKKKERKKKAADLHLQDAAVPEAQVLLHHARGIICGVIIRPRPHLSNSWSGTSRSIMRPLRHHSPPPKPPE